MGRRLIDISVALKEGIKSDPPHSLPKIEYMDHHMTAPAMAEYMGCASISCRMANMPLWSGAPPARIKRHAS